jgi:hypothetical protein
MSVLAQTAAPQMGTFECVMKSNRELINALREAPAPWIDATIVVAFENRFEFVAEDHANSS